MASAPAIPDAHKVSCPHSSVCDLTRQTMGFSLIELMIVVTIIAVLAGMASLSMGLFSPTRTVKTEAERFDALVRLLQDEAILNGREYGLIVYQNGVRIVEWYEPTEQDQKAYLKSTKKEQYGTPTQERGIALDSDEPPPLPGYWRPINNRRFKPSHLYPSQVEVVLWVNGAELDLPQLEEDEKLFLLLDEVKETGVEKLTAKLLKAMFDAAQLRPALMFLSSGEAEAFRARISWREDVAMRYEIASDIMGNITYLRPGEDERE